MSFTPSSPPDLRLAEAALPVCRGAVCLGVGAPLSPGGAAGPERALATAICPCSEPRGGAAEASRPRNCSTFLLTQPPLHPLPWVPTPRPAPGSRPIPRQPAASGAGWPRARPALQGRGLGPAASARWTADAAGGRTLVTPRGHVSVAYPAAVRRGGAGPGAARCPVGPVSALEEPGPLVLRADRGNSCWRGAKVLPSGTDRSVLCFSV